MSYPVLIIPEGVESSDGRTYPPGLLTWRDRYEFMFTDERTEGHLGAFQVGNITNIRRQTFEGQTWIIGDLDYDYDAEAAEAERLAVEDKIRRVSADVAAILEETGELDDMGFPVMVIVSAEIIGTTQTPMSAFGDARILTDTTEMADLPVLVAALPAEAKLDWFKDPQLDGPTRMTVDGNRIFGHLATWGECHTGFANVCRTPPKGTDYRYFHTGTLEVEGEKIEVGKITMDTGHAPLTFNATEARQAHYDNTGTCAADVCAGEDEYGIWVAGAVRDGVDAQILMASPLSGDWRKIGGHMELLAALAVNTPGFAPPRLQASTFNGEQVALVAAGIVVEEEPDPLAEIRERLEALEEKTKPVAYFPSVWSGSGTAVSPPGWQITQTPLVTSTPAPEMPPEVPNEWGKLAGILD